MKLKKVKIKEYNITDLRSSASVQVSEEMRKENRLLGSELVRVKEELSSVKDHDIKREKALSDLIKEKKAMIKWNACLIR